MKKEEYKVPIPENISEDELWKKGRSVFGGDHSLGHDLILITRLVERFTNRYKKENVKSIHKIFKVIQTQEWQEKYKPQETEIFYLFKMYVEMQNPTYKMIEISRMQLTIACMIIEGEIGPMEFSYSQKKDMELDCVIKRLFQQYYDLKMSDNAVNTIKGIRNAITHRGGISNLHPKLNEKTREHIEKLSKMTNLSSEKFIDSFIAEFLYLFEDMALRVMGLEQEDLAWNGRPAWRSDYWK